MSYKPTSKINLPELKENEKIITSLSGGLDSTTVLYALVDKYGADRIEAVSFNYGSKHNAHELPLAIKTCENLKVSHTIIKLDFMLEHFNSSLLKGGEDIPEGHYASDNMASTVVPFRNGIILSILAGLAESKNCDVIALGNHLGDGEETEDGILLAQYPDCSPSFTKAMHEAVHFGTSNHVNFISPFVNMNKTDIAYYAKYYNVDLALTWSCYNPTLVNGEYVQCGKCGTCVERIEAIHETGAEDSQKYALGDWPSCVDHMKKINDEFNAK